MGRNWCLNYKGFRTVSIWLVPSSNPSLNAFSKVFVRESFRGKKCMRPFAAKYEIWLYLMELTKEVACRLLVLTLQLPLILLTGGSIIYCFLINSEYLGLEMPEILMLNNYSLSSYISIFFLTELIIKILDCYRTTLHRRIVLN